MANRYYIVKPAQDEIDYKLLEKIRQSEPDAYIAEYPEYCDVAILQKGWDKSIVSIREKERIQKELGICCREGSMYKK